VKAAVANLVHRSVRYFDSGTGRTLLLLHAFPLSADQWLPQLHRVPPGWRFIAPDLRGFRGAGPAFEDPGVSGLSIDGYADDVLALLTHLDVDRAAVAGVSMGGYVAFGLMRRAPSRVSALVLANTRATADTEDARAGRHRMIEMVRREGVAAVAAAMTPRLLGETTRASQPDLEDAVRRLIIVNSAEGVVAALQALATRPDATPLLASIACPTVIVAGEEDAIIRVDEARMMHEAIAGSTLVTLPRVGHLSNLEDPAGWSRAVESVLT
jgi:pimeloyl-ACP methyl ester carboxylesterase